MPVHGCKTPLSKYMDILLLFDHVITTHDMVWELWMRPCMDYHGPRYYRTNSLPVNPRKTLVTAFHLKVEANLLLKVLCNNTELNNTTHPQYIGVTLDMTLNYKQHIN